MIKVEMIKWSLSNNDAAQDTDVRGRWHESTKLGALQAATHLRPFQTTAD